VILGKALNDGYREKVYVVTKLPTFLVCVQSIKIPEELKKVNEVIYNQKITVKEIFQMLLYAVRN